jgi:murein DD-endopeptidase MepM/ murein hydrolase activator NlpD
VAIQVPTGQRVAPGQLQGQARAADGSRGAVEAGRQMQQAGAAIQGLGQLATQIHTEQIEQVNETKVNAALAEAQAAAVTYQRDYSTLRGSNAMPDALGGQSLTEKFTGDFDRNLGEIAQTRGLNSVQLERYNARSQPLRNAFFESASKYEAAQFDTYAKATYETGVATYAESIVENWTNPEMLAVAVANMSQVTLAESQRLGLSPEAAAQTVASNVGKAVMNVVDSNVATDPQSMRDFVDSMSRSMLPSDLGTAYNKIGVQLDDIEGRAWFDEWRKGSSALPGETGSGSAAPLPGVTLETTMPIEGAELPTAPGKDYGPRTAFRTSNGRLSSSNHDGVDFSAPTGTPVRASIGGRVVRVGVNGGYGNYVEVEHPDGSRFGYAHMQDYNVKVGDQLAPGQTLGRVGSTGNSTGPHLHLRYIDANGSSADPALAFRGAATGSTGNASSSVPQGPAGPTRAAAIAEVNARFGNNPRRRAAALAAVNEYYSEFERADREAKENALDAAYAYIRDNKAMPPASMTLGLERNLGSLRGYFESVTAPPTRRDNDQVMLGLLGDPSQWKDLSPEEFEAAYGSHLSQSTLESFVRQLGTARAAAQGDPRTVDMQTFSRVWAEQLALAGAKDLDKDETTRQSAMQLQVRARDYILSQQLAKNPPRALTEEETAVALNTVVSSLAWEQPGWFGGPRASGVAVSYDTMAGSVRRRIEDQLKAQGITNPSKEQVFQAYLTDRIRIRR